mmetsp:Transcript_21726/g.35644  ORF Transcript_21726/g.35644 Transcript_21726/m.35644 type:complete len:123 (+) Transcript_21726:758-1126(+)
MQFASFVNHDLCIVLQCSRVSSPQECIEQVTTKVPKSATTSKGIKLDITKHFRKTNNHKEASQGNEPCESKRSLLEIPRHWRSAMATHIAMNNVDKRLHGTDLEVTPSVTNHNVTTPTQKKM